MVTGHLKQWEFLKNKFELGNLSHAYLFSGHKESKKELFANEFVKLINCRESKKPCQNCQNCRMIEKKGFLDLLVISSQNSESSLKNEKDMMEISVGQIRNLRNFLSYKPYYGNFKIVLIENAERMTFEAQSCFLKTLEEPKGKTIIFLVSSKPDMILPTIFSRCQEIKFFYKGKHEMSKDEEIIFENLKKSIGSQLAEKFKYAKNTDLEGENFSKIMGVLRKYFRQLMLSKIGLLNLEVKNYPIEKIRKIIGLIESISRQADTGNINNKMALEIILMEI